MEGQAAPGRPQRAFPLNESLSVSRSESWIELSSQPSNSSLSSANDEIVTTGLRVRRHRRQQERQRRGPSRLVARSETGSSQEEYEESDSEEEALQSSAENIQPTQSILSAPSRNSMPQQGEEDDDDNRTALGAPSRHRSSFVPQPNIFSRPVLEARATVPDTRRRHSFAPSRTAGGDADERRQPSHSPITYGGSTYAVDHDAALRASLSTLLSCAAAVRGSPKTISNSAPSPQAAALEPIGFRLMTEADFIDETQDPPAQRASIARVSSDSSAESPTIKNKRKSWSSRPSRDIASKKARNAMLRTTDQDDAALAPTILTWVVGAGVVVLVSAISFSAGYAMGKETGYIEAQAFMGDGMDYGSDAVQSGLKAGLRRFRWAGVTAT